MSKSVKLEVKDYTTMKQMLYDLNNAHDDGKNLNITMTATILFTEDSFTESYTEIQRTYVFSNDNKAFKSNMGGYSIFGSCADGTDSGVRLENYIYGEHGTWKPERCWIEIINKEERERGTLEDKIEELRFIVWEEDIASPTVPEYIEHHRSICKILDHIDNVLLPWINNVD